MAVATWGDTAIGSLQNILGSAVGSANDAVTSAQSGLAAILGGRGTVNDAVSKMGANADTMTGVANNTLSLANDAKGVYDSLSPIAALFGQRGSELWTEGSGLSSRATNLFGVGDSILNMDASAGGLAGEYVKAYNNLSPDRYVAQAASDTQASFQNAQAQSERQLARTGVSAGSGASLALKKQLATSLATALAANKTKARQTGIDEQSAYLDKMLAAVTQMYSTANATEQNALTAKSQSLTATGQQADTIASQAQGYVSVGGLQLNAGQLFGSAADVTKSAAELNNSYLSLVNSAYGNVASAQQNAASTKVQAAATEVSANNGTSATGGWTSSSSTTTDPWAATGHTSTWWKNNLSSSEFADMAKQIAASAN